eukprot:scaffold98125_cov33-Tisochrysis_lutea.AAC.1
MHSDALGLDMRASRERKCLYFSSLPPSLLPSSLPPSLLPSLLASLLRLSLPLCGGSPTPSVKCGALFRGDKAKRGQAGAPGWVGRAEMQPAGPPFPPSRAPSPRVQQHDLA